MNTMNQYRLLSALALLPLLGGVPGCSSDSDHEKTDVEFQQEVVSGMHDSLLSDIADLVQAAKDMQAAAPEPKGRGWDADEDADAISATKDAWVKARVAYEHIEGALAPIFPDIDASIDFRYDDFLADPQIGEDDDLFDDEGVTGMHAVERILWAPEIPQAVIDFEAALPGYQPAAFPATEAEAKAFKAKLVGRIITDATTLHDQWTPQKIDVGGAFQGLVSLMNEQREKVNKASTNEEESRYSQRTMADIRDNLDGTRKIFVIFQPWLQAKQGGDHIDQEIDDGFDKLNRLYSAVKGDAIPAPPASWSAESPSASDLSSPFGKLYSGVSDAVDPNTDGAIVFDMNEAATLLGFPIFQAE